MRYSRRLFWANLQSNHLSKHNCCECSFHVVYWITVCDKEVKPKPKLSDISSATALKDVTPSGTVIFSTVCVWSLKKNIKLRCSESAALCASINVPALKIREGYEVLLGQRWSYILCKSTGPHKGTSQPSTHSYIY